MLARYQRPAAPTCADNRNSGGQGPATGLFLDFSQKADVETEHHKSLRLHLIRLRLFQRLCFCWVSLYNLLLGVRRPLWAT